MIKSEIQITYTAMATDVQFFEKKSKFKELFDVVSAFTQIDEIAKRINWSECFKFALEQYGVENSNKFLKDKEET